VSDSDPNEPSAKPQKPGAEEPASSLPSWAVKLPEDAPAPLSPDPPSAGNHEPSTEVMEVVPAPEPSDAEPPAASPPEPAASAPAEPSAPEPSAPESAEPSGAAPVEPSAAPAPAAPAPAASEPAEPSAPEPSAPAPSALSTPEPPAAPPPVPPPALPPVAQNPEALPASGSGVAAKITALIPPGRPEIAIAAAFAAGFVLAQILRRLAR
jgi:hypothetical protein